MNKNMEKNSELLRVDSLKAWFPVKKGVFKRTHGYVRAVDGVSFSVRSGKSVGLVGESGCGKTTVARTLIRLIKPTEGRVCFDGMSVFDAGRADMRRFRRDVGMIFQDPYGSLNPRMTVGRIVGEPLRVQKRLRGQALSGRVEELLSKVGLGPSVINRYPHEFSGGQRQRIGVARALALDPKLVICDEPVSALDVSIQSQILNLLKDLQDELGLTYLFIAHDLAVVEFFCDVVAVMYMARIVEQAAADELYRSPMHPYTQALLSAIPQVESEKQAARIKLRGEVPSAMNVPSGCPFHPRCPLCEQRCTGEIQQLKETEPGSGHFVACWKTFKNGN